LEDKKRLVMVDGGGGNAVLHQLRHADYVWMNIRHILVPHKHIDHLLGIIWMVRMEAKYRAARMRDNGSGNKVFS
jgi:ribonuclease Z